MTLTHLGASAWYHQWQFPWPLLLQLFQRLHVPTIPTLNCFISQVYLIASIFLMESDRNSFCIRSISRRIEKKWESQISSDLVRFWKSSNLIPVENGSLTGHGPQWLNDHLQLPGVKCLQRWIREPGKKPQKLKTLNSQLKSQIKNQQFSVAVLKESLFLMTLGLRFLKRKTKIWFWGTDELSANWTHRLVLYLMLKWGLN